MWQINLGGNRLGGWLEQFRENGRELERISNEWERIAAINRTRPAAGTMTRPTPSVADEIRKRLAAYEVESLSDKIATYDVARHESGHGLEVLLSGGQVTEVVAGPDGGRCGHENVPANRRIPMLVAGWVAESRGWYDEFLDDHSGAGCDREQVVKLLRDEFLQSPHAWICEGVRREREPSDEDLRIHASRWIEDVESDLAMHRPFVSALTARLVQDGRVDGVAVHQMWDEHLKSGRRFMD